MDLTTALKSKNNVLQPKITGKLIHGELTDPMNDYVSIVKSGNENFEVNQQKTDIHDNSDYFHSGASTGILIQHSLSKKAIDLSIHVRRGSRSIFEDADLFSRNHSYKLMPISFDIVNETIIRIEHNYCLRETSENFSSREPLKTDTEDSCYEAYDLSKPEANDIVSGSAFPSVGEESIPKSDSLHEGDSIKPLDLSLPLEMKIGNTKSRENQSGSAKMKLESEAEEARNESDKENRISRKIEVTISRPGLKEEYEPCEIFLNDVARISSDLIKNDCYEIDLVDRTREHNFQREKLRMYYIVSETSWRTFTNSTDRIVLTNDLNLGNPVPNSERVTKPKYLIFDQCSLTESLAEICRKKGGRFEYTCLDGEYKTGCIEKNNTEEYTEANAKKIQKTESNGQAEICEVGFLGEPESAIERETNTVESKRLESRDSDVDAVLGKETALPREGSSGKSRRKPRSKKSGDVTGKKPKSARTSSDKTRKRKSYDGPSNSSPRKTRSAAFVNKNENVCRVRTVVNESGDVNSAVIVKRERKGREAKEGKNRAIEIGVRTRSCSGSVITRSGAKRKRDREWGKAMEGAERRILRPKGNRGNGAKR